MQSLVLNGAITGRSRKNGPVDPLGNPVEHSHDKDVTLTVTIYPPGGYATVMAVHFESLERGTLEIGDPVTVAIAAVQSLSEPAAPSDAKILDERGAGDEILAEDAL
jgi:hypothetical protein